MNEDRPHTVDDDVPLVSSWRNGELAAFEDLVLRHQKRMFNIAFRLTGDYEVACDVVQDVFVAAYRGIESFRNTARFTTWLTGIAVDQSRNRRRPLRFEEGNEDSSFDGGPAVDDAGLVDERMEAAPSTREQLERLIVHEKLQECLDAISPEFREVLVLRDVQNFSYEEMGAILQIRPGIVMSRLSQAREMVKDCLKRTMGDGR